MGWGFYYTKIGIKRNLQNKSANFFYSCGLKSGEKRCLETVHAKCELRGTGIKDFSKSGRVHPATILN
jgi:hypothetical protein